MSDWRSLIERPEWIEQANCRGMGPDLFFPASGETVAPIQKVCRACDVQAECLAYAMNNHETHGIWGGVSEHQRRNLSQTVSAS